MMEETKTLSNSIGGMFFSKTNPSAGYLDYKQNH